MFLSPTMISKKHQTQATTGKLIHMPITTGKLIKMPKCHRVNSDNKHTFDNMFLLYRKIQNEIAKARIVAYTSHSKARLQFEKRTTETKG